VRHASVKDDKPLCKYCKTCDVNSKILSCSKCNTVKYCSNLCKNRDYANHNKLCDAIHKLSKQERMKLEQLGQYQSHYTPRKQNKLVNLVGKRSVIRCFANDVKTEMMWDTGANISVINKDYLYNLFPNCSIRNLCEILDDTDQFNVKWGNQNSLPYDGWIDLNVSLQKKGETVLVPFLVTTDPLETSILGTNAIEHLTKCVGEKEKIVKVFQNCFPDKSVEVRSKLINLITAEDDDFISQVHTKEAITLPAHQEVQVKCRMKRNYFSTQVPVSFEPSEDVNKETFAAVSSILNLKKGSQKFINIPIVNRSSFDIKLPPKTYLVQFIRFNRLHLLSKCN